MPESYVPTRLFTPEECREILNTPAFYTKLDRGQKVMYWKQEFPVRLNKANETLWAIFGKENIEKAKLVQERMQLLADRTANSDISADFLFLRDIITGFPIAFKNYEEMLAVTSMVMFELDELIADFTDSAKELETEYTRKTQELGSLKTKYQRLLMEVERDQFDFERRIEQNPEAEDKGVASTTASRINVNGPSIVQKPSISSTARNDDAPRGEMDQMVNAPQEGMDQMVNGSEEAVDQMVHGAYKEPDQMVNEKSPKPKKEISKLASVFPKATLPNKFAPPKLDYDSALIRISTKPRAVRAFYLLRDVKRATVQELATALGETYDQVWRGVKEIVAARLAIKDGRYVNIVERENYG